MENWLAKLLISIAASIVAGLVVWYLTQTPVEDDSVISKQHPGPVEEPVQSEQNRDYQEKNEPLELSRLLMIGKVTKLYPQYFIVLVTFELAPASNELYVQVKNGRFITATVQKRYEKYWSATSFQQDKIQTGASVFVRRN